MKTNIKGNSENPLIRAFVAVPIPESVAVEIENYVSYLKKFANLRWVKSVQLHMTLCFIGEQSTDIIEHIQNNLTKVQFTPFEIKLSYSGAFPNMNRPRALWLSGKQGINELKILADQVNRCVDMSGITIDKRAFKPHLTLARTDGTPLGSELALALQTVPKLAWTCDRIDLMRSILSPRGSVYTKIQSYHAQLEKS